MRFVINDLNFDFEGSEDCEGSSVQVKVTLMAFFGMQPMSYPDKTCSTLKLYLSPYLYTMLVIFTEINDF